MIRRIHIVFVNYTCSDDCKDPGDWLRKIAAHLPLLRAMALECKVSYVTRIGWEGAVEADNVQYYFIPRHAGDRYFPVTMHRQIRKLMPDKVIVAGLHYPLQVLQLRKILERSCRIFARHHADKPFSGVKGWMQRRADRSIDRYLFTSAGNADEWISKGIISSPRKLAELPATAPGFRRKPRSQARAATGVQGSPVFLWAGRLDANKDPLTVVRAFCAFATQCPDASLYMIYQTDELRQQIIEILNTNVQAQVKMIGKVSYTEMENWLSAADLFVSGSHREGGSYALLEAMACGCIPIVTAIAPALKVTAGKGFSYPPGDVHGLLQCMLQAAAADLSRASDEAEDHFMCHYTAEKLAVSLAAL